MLKRRSLILTALLADSLILQHSRQQQPISIQSATLKQQALFGAMPSAVREATIAAKDEQSLRQPKIVQRSTSGLFNMMRNLGKSVGIAVVGTLLTRREQVHFNRLGEAVSLYSLDQ